ncbi:MAG: ZIP family metal transporter [Oscillibacter sp.]|jgi:ZIP family zinc transporter|nr:ZIP family metal transporter [Oscillibacter sp.]
MGFVWKIILITALAGMGGTGMGGIVSCLFRKDSSRTVSLLLSFAAGVMTAVVCFDLLSSAINPEQATEQTNIFLIVLGVMGGYAVIAALNAWIDRDTDHEVAHIDKGHPKTADSLEELTHANHLAEHQSGRQPRSSLFLAGLVMAAAIALHNVPEGMVIGASFAKSADMELLNRSGLVMATVIGLHNIPEGMAVAVPLISGGMPKAKAAALTACTGAPTILGAIAGYFLGTMGPLALALSLSFASGAMLYVVFGELLPESILMWRSKLPALAVIIGMMTGLLIIYS